MLTTWNAFSALDRLFDDVMNDAMGRPLGASLATAQFAPAADIRANDEEVVLSFDVPGLAREDLELNVENGVLTVKGQRKYEGTEKDKAWIGRRYGAFSVSYQLPDTVDLDRVEAKLEQGVLTIRAPKHERAKPRKIEIGGSSEHKQLTQNSSSMENNS
jgi:HSP20 family protein